MAARKNSGSSRNNNMNMKIMLIVALIVTFLSGYFLARAKYKPQLVELSKMIINKDQAMEKVKSNANKVMMKDDKVWIVENGMARMMDSDTMMTNGDKVLQDGTVVKTDGTKTILKNGDAVDMNGRMMEGS